MTQVSISDLMILLVMIFIVCLCVKEKVNERKELKRINSEVKKNLEMIRKRNDYALEQFEEQRKKFEAQKEKEKEKERERLMLENYDSPPRGCTLSELKKFIDEGGDLNDRFGLKDIKKD